MKSRIEEEAYLVLAERHIAEAEQRIRLQKNQLDELIANGVDATEKAKFIALMMDGVEIMRRHREQILVALTVITSRQTHLAVSKNEHCS